MQQSLIKLIVSQGIFAVLFVYLLFYVLKENSKRESNYQQIVNELSQTLPGIEEKFNSISKQLENNKKITGPNNQTLTVEKCTNKPLGQKLYINYGENSFENAEIEFVGTDNLGNHVEFGMRYRDGNKAMFEFSGLTSNLSEEATEITLQSHYVELPESGGQITNNYKNFGEPFTVNLK